MPTARRVWTWALFALLVGGAAAAARADVIFSTLPANGESGWTATGADSPSGAADYDLAQRFTVAATRRFTDVQLPLYTARGPGVATVWLMADGGSLPGAVIEEMHVTDIPGGTGVGWPLRTVPSALTPVLSAGQTYWIGLSTDRGSDVAWGEVASGDNGHWYRVNQGPWQYDGFNDASAFRVNGVPVPEPSCGAGVVMLLAAALGRPRRVEVRQANCLSESAAAPSLPRRVGEGCA
jgi:hypothetical protein